MSIFLTKANSFAFLLARAIAANCTRATKTNYVIIGTVWPRTKP